MPSVLFLCTGNYYRSRFAEMLFNHLAERRGLNWRADSRGLKLGWPGNVGPMSVHTRQRLNAMGIAIRDVNRMPIECTMDDLQEADQVIAVKEAEHRAMVRDKFGDWESRVKYWHVHDLDGAMPAEALDEIERLVIELIDELAARPVLTKAQ